MVLHAAWLVFLFGLGIWWVSLMLEQAGRIATLEQAAGVTPGAAQEQWMRTERMLFWEGGTFFGALFARGDTSREAGVGLYLTAQLMRRMGGEACFQPGPTGFETRLLFRSEDLYA